MHYFVPINGMIRAPLHLAAPTHGAGILFADSCDPQPGSIEKECYMHSATGKLMSLGTCLLLLCSASFGNVITFNQLLGNGSPVPNGYGGLDWNNFAAMTMPPPAAAFTVAPATGSFAFNKGGAPASFSSPNACTFTSGMLSTMGPSHIGLEIVGTLGGKPVDSVIINLSTVPVQETFNWSGIDGVRFVPQPGSNINAKFPFALEQLVINQPSVPEPASMMLFGSGAGLAFAGLRKRFGR
jgi:hypothetical protein